MDRDIYQELQSRIDRYSVGMNPTEQGREIAVLKRLFTPEEARVYLAMGRRLEPAGLIAGRAGLELVEASRILSSMEAKGLVFPKTHRGVKHYAAAPFMHGFFEHQLYRKDPDPELPRLIEDYLTSGFMPKARALRTIPIGADLEGFRRVLTFDDVRAIVMAKDRIGLFECACSHHMGSLGLRRCSHPLDVCIAFDFYAEYPIEEIGYGRWITREEALGVLERAEEHGLVHQAGGDARNVECICNCCSDCCTILRFLKLLPNPSAVQSSNYVTVYDEARCAACHACSRICPMGAISMTDSGPVLNPDRCIGCGLCVSACVRGARSLEQKPAERVRRPPSPERYTFMRSSLDYRADLEDRDQDP
jgi:formate hydrogenlyase subunit 6/NADH:ubiquinone oxidoreductase subunit I